MSLFTPPTVLLSSTEPVADDAVDSLTELALIVACKYVIENVCYTRIAMAI